MGAGGDGRTAQSQSISGKLATVQTQVKISQSMFQQRQREAAEGGRGECTSTQKGRCRKWELAGFIIELYNVCDHLKGYFM